jgi:ubiquinol-cytochrome c reductase cytochrome c1 subunit
MRKALAALVLILTPAITLGSGGEGQLESARVDLSDTASLQRGARTFVNFCLSCHSASYMRYERMASDLKIDPKLVEENMMFAADKIGSLMTVTMPVEESKKWFGKAPPDLGTMARARGADYIYSYMKGFYVDETTPTGWNNVAFPSVGMPHVLWKWQGEQRAVFETDENGNKHFAHFEVAQPGEMTPEEYDEAVRDLTNFMVYLAEPAKLKRYTIGFWVIVFLLIMVGLTYALKKEYWRDVH